MLFKLSFRNIRRSIKDYTVYFFTLILGISLFYVFNAIESQTAMMNLSSTAHELINLMGGVMTALGVLVAIILGLLIIYANRFLMKRRKKEFGIYMTLGMSKGQISRILLVETLIIGILSLVIGLLVGIGLSQVMSVFVANLFEANMANFEFVFSETSFIWTIIAFGVTYLIVMILNIVTTGRQKLINLIHSAKLNEKVKVRNLPLSILIITSSIGILAYAYYAITGDVRNLDDVKLIVLIALGCFGTFLFFWGLAGIAIRILPKFKNFYYNGLNTFIFREINGKINTTIVSMTVICILLFFTIIIFSSAMSINNTFTKDLRDLIPADFQASKIINSNKETAKETLVQSGIDIKKDLSNWADITIYKTEDITYQQTIGSEAISTMGTFDDQALLQISESIVHISEYNSLASLYGHEEFELSPNEYIVVANYNDAVSVRNQALEQNSPTIIIDNINLTPKYNEVKDGFIEMSSNRVNTGIIIVPDSINLIGKETSSFIAGNYNLNDEKQKTVLDNKLLEIAPKDNILMIVDTKTELYDQSIGLSAIVTFIGLYLGIIFLIASAALLSLKELSDSSDNQEKYSILRKLGSNKKSLNRALFVQIAIFFGLPLFLAIIHSIFGIIFVNNVILAYMTSGLLTPIVMTIAFMTVIYGGYFVITYFTSKRIVLTK